MLFKDPWQFNVELQIEMRFRESGSAVGVNLVTAAANVSVRLFLRFAEYIACDAVAELIKVEAILLIELGYISGIGTGNMQRGKHICDFVGQSSGLCVGKKIAAISAFAAPFLGACVPFGSGGGVYFGFITKKISLKHFLTPLDGMSI